MLHTEALNFGCKIKYSNFLKKANSWNIYCLKGVINGLPLARLFVQRLVKFMLFMVFPQFFPLNVMLAGRER